MPFTLTMPKLSPTMEEGVITHWHKKEGDFVEAGDILIEVATDKATVEYEALDEGWLKKILIVQEKSARVNEAIAVFTEQEEESIEGYAPEGLLVEEEKESPPSPEAKETVQKKQPAQVVGAALSQPAFCPEEPLKDYQFNFLQESTEERVKASPLARKLSKEKKLDLRTVKGTGPSGRIMSHDLKLAQPDGAFAFGRQEVPGVDPGTYEEETLTPMRKAIGERLAEAKIFLPHFYVSQKVDADPMHTLREQLKQMGVKVTFNDFVVKACAMSLREHPVINSGFNSVNESIVRFKTIDVAVAVSLEAGLITPIIRHADYKNLGQVAVEVRDLALKAREGKLEHHEYRGGSFTVSNLGMFGISHFTAIINPPQAAILAVGAVEEVPVVKEGQVIPGRVMQMTLSSDHRVIDGAAAAAFLKTLRKYLENPAILLL